MQSNYISSNRGVKKGLHVNSFYLLFLILGLLISSLGVFSTVNKSTTVEGFGFLCAGEDSLGYNMNQGAWDAGLSPAAYTDRGDKTWTLLEAFGENIGFANYHGEGEGGSSLVRSVSTDRGTDEPAWSETLPLLENERTVANCTWNTFIVTMSDAVFAFGTLGMSITNTFVDAAFNGNLVCKNAGDGSGCFDLIGIIGGNPSNGTEGIIGSLFSGIFMPLIVLVIVVSAVTVLWLGIVKRQFRQAFGALVWVLLSFMAGIIILTNPQLTAKAPTAITNTIASCVIGAFNGENCMSGDTSINMSSNVKTSNNICVSNVRGINADEKMRLTIQGLNCSIWRAFILEPWSQGQFGRSFIEMDVEDPVISTAIENAGYNKSKFCVNLGSSSPMKGRETLTLDSDSNVVCNLAAYQLFLSTNATSGGGDTLSSYNPGASTGESEVNSRVTSYDSRWYPLILTLAQDDNMWSNWSKYTTASKLSSAAVSFMAGLTGSVIIFVTSLYALVYLLSSIILIALIPLFLLIGVHPTRGKRILLGYGETLISAMLKYLASAGFLILALSLYGAVLGTGESLIKTLMFVIVLSFALFMYRAEIVNLIGRVNMGGERLSSRFTDNIEKRAKSLGKKTLRTGVAHQASRIGVRMAYGRIGSKPEGMSDREWEDNRKSMIAERDRAVKAGGREAVRRELKSAGTGIIGTTISQATRQYERTSQDNKRDLYQAANFDKEQRSKLAQRKEDLNIDIREKEEELRDKNKELNESNGIFHDVLEVDTKLRYREDAALMEINQPNFSEYHHLLRELKELRVAQVLANAGGDKDAYDSLVNRENQVLSRIEDTRDSIDDADFNKYSQQYENLMDTYVSDEKDVKEYYQAQQKAEQSGQLDHDKLYESANDYSRKLSEYNNVDKIYQEYKDQELLVEKEIAAANKRIELFTETYINLPAGEVLRNSDIAEIQEEISKEANMVKADLTRTIKPRYEKTENSTADKFLEKNIDKLDTPLNEIDYKREEQERRVLENDQKIEEEFNRRKKESEEVVFDESHLDDYRASEEAELQRRRAEREQRRNQAPQVVNPNQTREDNISESRMPELNVDDHRHDREQSPTQQQPAQQDRVNTTQATPQSQPTQRQPREDNTKVNTSESRMPELNVDAQRHDREQSPTQQQPASMQQQPAQQDRVNTTQATPQSQPTQTPASQSGRGNTPVEEPRRVNNNQNESVGNESSKNETSSKSRVKEESPRQSSRDDKGESKRGQRRSTRESESRGSQNNRAQEPEKRLNTQQSTREKRLRDNPLNPRNRRKDR